MAVCGWPSPHLTFVQASIRFQPPTRGSVLIILYKGAAGIAPMTVS